MNVKKASEVSIKLPLNYLSYLNETTSNYLSNLNETTSIESQSTYIEVYTFLSSLYMLCFQLVSSNILLISISCPSSDLISLVYLVLNLTSSLHLDFHRILHIALHLYPHLINQSFCPPLLSFTSFLYFSPFILLN